MYIEIDVQAGANCDYSLTRMFSAVSDPVPITHVEAPGPKGEMAVYEVTGWSSDGPCPAYAVIVEDSGEGRALLIYGGDDGVRLRPQGSLTPWSLEGADQWGEPCLLLDQDSSVEKASPGE